MQKTYPSAQDDSSSAPTHSVVIEYWIRKGKLRASDNFHNKVFDNCGDADVITGHNKMIDPTH